LQDFKPQNARSIKEAKALEVEEINSKNTIIVETPVEGNPIRGSNPIKGSNSPLEGEYTNLRKKDKNRIKAKKANRAKSKVWPLRGFAESL
jgi:hypothetical protein